MKYDPDTVKAWVGCSQWRALRADLARFQDSGFTGWGSEGFWALTLYRLQKIAQHASPRWIWAPARAGLAIVKKLFTCITHISLNPNAQIGPGMLIPYAGCIRVHGDTRIGADCVLFHQCTIGANARSAGAVIGDHVRIGCHSSIVGPVVIGDSATIAPNSLVVTDVPAGATVVGVPARALHPTALSKIEYQSISTYGLFSGSQPCEAVTRRERNAKVNSGVR